MKSFLSKPLNLACSFAAFCIVSLAVIYMFTSAATTTKIADTSGDALGVGTGSFIGGVPEFAAGVSRTVKMSNVAGAEGATDPTSAAEAKAAAAEKKARAAEARAKKAEAKAKAAEKAANR